MASNGWACPATAALLCCMLACRTTPADVKAAAFVPADTVVLAGLDLDHLRASPLYSKLPAAVAAVAGSYANASSALLAYNGKDLLAIARGQFAQAPPGATLAAPNLALFGSPKLVAAALAQQRSGVNGAPALAALGDSIAAGHQIWIVMQGGAPLPLTGNAANYNQLIRKSESVTIGANFDSGLALAITAVGRTTAAARDIEETIRADLTLGAAALSRQPGLAKLLRSVRIDRNDRTVRITLAADPDAAAKLLSSIGL